MRGHGLRSSTRSRARSMAMRSSWCAAPPPVCCRCCSLTPCLDGQAYTGRIAHLFRAAAMPVIAVTHPLVRHKIGLLREAEISTKKFRELTGELARLLAYEATADFPLAKATINCWSGLTEIEQIAGRKVT